MISLDKRLRPSSVCSSPTKVGKTYERIEEYESKPHVKDFINNSAYKCSNTISDLKSRVRRHRENHKNRSVVSINHERECSLKVI